MMNDTTLEIWSNNSIYNNRLHISNIVWRTCGILCTIFGIPGHLFHIIITLNKNNRKESTSLYYTAMAISELIFIFGVFWLWCVGMSIIKIDPRQILSCGIFYSILMGPTILSNLYLASMSIDRTCMVLYPTYYRLIVTQRHVLIRIFLILIIVSIFMIPHHYYYYYNKETTIFICQFYTSIDHWRIRLWPLLHFIVFVLLPSIITCISYIILSHNRCNHRKMHKHKISENARRLERNSLLLLLFSFIISLTILPTVILEIFIVHEQLFNHGNIPLIKWKKYKILLNWFLSIGTMNYSFKFYMRLAISKTFQHDFIQLINCILQRKEKTKEQHLVPLNNHRQTKHTEI